MTRHLLRASTASTVGKHAVPEISVRNAAEEIRTLIMPFSSLLCIEFKSGAWRQGAVSTLVSGALKFR